MPYDMLFCDVCTQGKQAHAAINTAPDDSTKVPLQMVHSDLAGPMIIMDLLPTIT